MSYTCSPIRSYICMSLPVASGAVAVSWSRGNWLRMFGRTSARNVSSTKPGVPRCSRGTACQLSHWGYNDSTLNVGAGIAMAGSRCTCGHADEE